MKLVTLSWVYESHIIIAINIIVIAIRMVLKTR